MAELSTGISCSYSSTLVSQHLTLRPWPCHPRLRFPTVNIPPSQCSSCSFGSVYKSCSPQATGNGQEEHGRDTSSKTPEQRKNVKRGSRKRSSVSSSLAANEVSMLADFRLPSKLQKQLQHERVVDSPPDLTPKRSHSTHKLLRVMAGKVGGRKLLSPKDMHVRPMMEVVRGAVFNILQALGGFSVGLSGGCWLDLYSGTGSVGIEALSRGCSMAHFVENDPWIVSNVLMPNLKATNFHEQAVVHTTQVESYLQRTPDRKGEVGFFDYVSVTPPYELVDYPSLLDSLSKSSVIGKSTILVVEYPLKSRNEMSDTCGMLVKIQDRRYGRTNIAIYGPEWAAR